jgi:hypothetical protein
VYQTFVILNHAKLNELYSSEKSFFNSSSFSTTYMLLCHHDAVNATRGKDKSSNFLSRIIENICQRM